MKTFKILSLLMFAFVPLAYADHEDYMDSCPDTITVGDDVFAQIQQEALSKVEDLEDHKKLNERISLIIKVTVRASSLSGGECLITKPVKIQDGKKGEQILTIVATATVAASKDNPAFALVADSVRSVQVKDPYSNLKPTFSSVLNEEKRQLEKNGPAGDGILGNSFKDLRPALAVRGAGCLICHANIKANMITDFGYGDPFFFNKGSEEGHSVYFDYLAHENKSWQDNSFVTQNLIVPYAIVDEHKQKYQLSLLDKNKRPKKDGPITVAEYLKIPMDLPQVKTAMGVGMKNIVEKKTVYIGAPTEKELQDLAPDLKSKSAGFLLVGGGDWESKKPVSLQFAVKNDGAGDYVTNSEPIVDCNGDIVVKGTLFLNGVTFRVKDDGCRLYVAGTVFIQSPPKFETVGEDASPAAQITSSSGIFMGFDTNTLYHRFGFDDGNLWYIAALMETRGGSGKNNFDRILGDARKIGSQMRDAGDGNIPMKGMLLNAPYVMSRYKGTFTGAVIAEIALFRVGQFDFEFDDDVLSSDFFPLLKHPILKVSDK